MGEAVATAMGAPVTASNVQNIVATETFGRRRLSLMSRMLATATGVHVTYDVQLDTLGVAPVMTFTHSTDGTTAPAGATALVLTGASTCATGTCNAPTSAPMAIAAGQPVSGAGIKEGTVVSKYIDATAEW